MSSIAKSDLEQLTERSIQVGLLNLVLLTATACPIEKLYETSEDLVNRAEDLRKALGLKEMTLDEIAKGLFPEDIINDMNAAMNKIFTKRQTEKLGSQTSFTATPDKNAN